MSMGEIGTEQMTLRTAMAITSMKEPNFIAESLKATFPEIAKAVKRLREEVERLQNNEVAADCGNEMNSHLNRRSCVVSAAIQAHEARFHEVVGAQAEQNTTPDTFLTGET